MEILTIYTVALIAFVATILIHQVTRYFTDDSADTKPTAVIACAFVFWLLTKNGAVAFVAFFAGVLGHFFSVYLTKVILGKIKPAASNSEKDTNSDTDA